MSHLVVCGLNYHSTPIAIRERFVIPESCIAHALEGLTRFPNLQEAAILSTCNRTEVYAVVTDIKAGIREIESFFKSAQSIEDHSALSPNFRLMREDVALHLMRVASGLDSLILGEGQIMYQVKAAHQAALAAKTAGPILDHLFKLALQAGKRVRSETTLGRRSVSISSAAVEMARESLGSLKGKNITIVGAGKMAQICLKYLSSSKSGAKVNWLNRSAETINNFFSCSEKKVGNINTSFAFDKRYEIASQSDLVIVATASKDYLFEKEEWQALSMKGADSKSKRNCLVIDISVPRNVDPALGELEGITLKHADDLKEIVGKNLKERQSLVDEAESLIYETLEEFHNWHRNRLVVPTIAGLREKIEAIRIEQMTKGISGTCAVSSQQENGNMEEISRAIVNQILHHPTVQLKATKDYEVLRQQAEALRTLFNLDPLEEFSRTNQRSRGKNSSQSLTRPSVCH